MIGNYTLITNLEYVTIGDVRTYTHALLIEEYENYPGAGPTYRLRGFGADIAIATFGIALTSSRYSLDICPDAEYLQVTGRCYEADIIANVTRMDSAHDFQIDTFTNVDIFAVYHLIPRRVAQFWIHPAMPVVTWRPAQSVRATLAANTDADARSGSAP